MNIIQHPDNYNWCSDTMWPSITGLPVYIIMHIKDGFIDQEIPLMSVKQSTVGDERDINDFTWVTIEDTPVDIFSKLSPEIFELVKQFIKLNKLSLIKFWEHQTINIGSIRDMVKPIHVIK